MPDTNNGEQQEVPENPENPGTVTYVTTGSAFEPENFSVTLHGTCTIGAVDKTWFLVSDTEDSL
ncbi:MAG: hypothetical protein IJ636_01620, partial [Bacteroidales bacterium]|nr:hypothetical protein [Bacteroidales bacterium]